MTKNRLNGKSMLLSLLVILIFLMPLAFSDADAQDNPDSSDSGSEQASDSKETNSEQTDEPSEEQIEDSGETDGSEETDESGETGGSEQSDDSQDSSDGDGQEETDNSDNSNDPENDESGQGEESADNGDGDEEGDGEDNNDSQDSAGSGSSENSDDPGDEQSDDENNDSGDEDNDPDDNEDGSDDDDEEDSKNPGNSKNDCNGVVCEDDNECTIDYCEDYRCYYKQIPRCTPALQTPVQENNPYDFDTVLINEIEGDIFGIETIKRQYSAGEDIWTVINAPEGADVELALTYDGIKQYIKIPKEKSFPLEYLVPIPKNLKKGVYALRAAVYYAGNILKTDTHFEIIDESQPIIPIASSGLVSEKGYYYNQDRYSKDIEEINEPENQQTPKQAEQIKESPKNNIIQEDNTLEIGKPVKWQKKVNITNTDPEEIQVEVSVDLPESAKKIKVKASDSDSNLDAEKVGGDLIINDLVKAKENKKYIVEFETKPPEKVEETPEKSGAGWKKKVIIKSDPEYEGEFEYKNILSYTDIKESSQEDIRLVWKLDDQDIDVTDDPSFDIKYHDTNNNGLIDRISWITPHLSVQEFEVVIILATASFDSLRATLIAPDAEHFNNNSEVDFRFVVSYNKSLELYCSLLIDEAAAETVFVSDGEEKTTSLNLDLAQGIHYWHVECFDQMNNTHSSSKKLFYIDYEGPDIELKNQDSELSLENSITLKYSAQDNLAQYVGCNLSVDGQIKGTAALASNEEETVTVNELKNGTHYWSVSCLDEAGNIGSSAAKSFRIDIERNFSVMTNKPEYRLSEAAIFQLNAPKGSSAKIVITDPESSSEIRNYNQFPVIDEIQSLDSSGEYTIEAYFTYSSAVKKSSTAFTVSNSLSISIDANKTRVPKGSIIGFKAESHGGIGNCTYTWDFDDGSAESEGEYVSHQYNNYGTFDVKVTAVDKKGNTASDTQPIRVQDDYSLKIIVVDSETGDPIKDARVYLEGDLKKTSSSGTANYHVFRGKHDIVIKYSNYHTYFNSIDVSTNTELEAKLKKISLESDTKESANTQKSSGSQTEPNTEKEITSFTLSNKAEEALSKVNSALNDINQHDQQEKRIADILQMKEKLENAKVLLSIAERDLFNLKDNQRGLTQDEMNQEMKEIENRIRDITRDLIISITVESQNKYSLNPSEEDIKTIISEYVASLNTKDQKSLSSSFENKNLKAQSSISVERESSSGEIEYFSGNKHQVTFIIEDIEFEKQPDKSSLVIYIPKNVAETTNDIEVLTEHKILNTDPLIQFSTDNSQIAYYIKKNSETEGIITALIKDPETGSGGIIGITGLSILSDVEIENPILFIEIIAIFILLIVFLTYQFDLFEKVIAASRVRMPRIPSDKELSSIAGIMKSIKNSINKKDLSKVSSDYIKLMEEYRKLSKRSKAKVHKQTLDLYNKITMAQINQEIRMALKNIKNNNPNLAKSYYEKVSRTYRKLPKSYRSKVCSKCRKIHEKLKD